MGPKLAVDTDYSSARLTEKKSPDIPDTWGFGPKNEKITPENTW